MEIGRVVREAREQKGWSQEDLAKRAGDIGQSTVDRIEKGNFKRMPSHLPAIAAVLGIPLPTLGDERRAGEIIPTIRGATDFKVYAAAEGGPGEIIVNTEPIDVILRPGIVQHVKDAYGLVITGNSMFPEFRPGETAIVNPKLPIIANEVYIFYAEREGEARASIKELKRMTDKEWRVEQHNPPPGKPKEFSLSRKEWGWAHRVVGKHART